MADDFSNTLAIEAISIVPMRGGVGRRECPILPIRRKIIRRSAHAAAIHIETAMRPQVRSAAIGSQRQVMIETDRQATLLRECLDGGKLLVNNELNVFIKIERMRMPRGEGLTGPRFRRLVFHGPIAP